MTSNKDFAKIVEMDDKIRLGEATHEDKVIMIENIRKSRKCPCCGCEDGNHAQECTIYYNLGYGKRSK